MAKELQFRVVTPDRTVFDQKVSGVSFMGVDGSYGILANHAALMTATVPGLVSITHSDGQREEMLITDGFAEMRNNVLSLICNAGELAHEIDADRAAQAEQRAREDLDCGLDEGADLPRAEASLRRAMLRQLISKRSRRTPG
ncbi:MAG: ATP synthase F1 subunit epsilon [Planctomycetota bacterium]|jgi:F-type H+-transporting ATPase subunit epsilon|nr:ATP synthase F1 subunit epsilon [Planctomycetota bacterium]